LTIRLSKEIYTTSFTLEHISSSINPNGASTPRHVSVYGLDDQLNMSSAQLLAVYEYNNNGPSIQTFEASVSFMITKEKKK
jgi:hypothetical protein